MIIVVLGAAGKTGQEVVNQALAAGHRVHALVRRADGMAARANLEVFVGDATRAKDVAGASRGADVIISALRRTLSAELVSCGSGRKSCPVPS